VALPVVMPSQSGAGVRLWLVGLFRKCDQACGRKNALEFFPGPVVQVLSRPSCRLVHAVLSFLSGLARNHPRALVDDIAALPP
jgi:hypothetical protein